LANRKALDRGLLAQLKQEIEAKLSEMEQTIRLRRDQGIDAALQVVLSDRGKQLMDSVRSLLEKIEGQQRQKFHQASLRTQRATYMRTSAFILTAMANLAFLSWVYRVIRHEIRSREAVEQQLRDSHAELETRVQQRTAELTTANRELEAFGYTVSHDLRAPLRHVSSYVKLLEQNLGDKADEKSQRFLRIIAAAAQRMGLMIDDLLALSRIGRSAIKEEAIPLGNLLDEARHELEPMTRERQIEWHVGDLPAVRGDRSLLRSVLVNLLSNAIKYTQGRKVARIDIDWGNQDGQLVFAVRDNGAGFDMRFVDKLFGVFQRLHGSGEYEGTGIGLASVRRAIQKHGGKTWAEGKPDVGAAFFFSMPADRLI
jgi:light-regulated signal transduction histidine kinase (bacteriophytochrome)